MYNSDRRRARRLAALAVAAALMLGATACGDDGSASGGGPSTSKTSETTDKGVVTALIEQAGGLFEKRDSAALCAVMTQAAQRARAAEAKSLAAFMDAKSATKTKPTCQASIDIALSGNVVEDFQPKIVSVTIDGDKARVVGRQSHASGDQVATLAKEHGEWKLVKWFESRG